MFENCLNTEKWTYFTFLILYLIDLEITIQRMSVLGMGSPRKRNQIISSDESSDDEKSGFRNKNSLVSDDSQPINKNRKG